MTRRSSLIVPAATHRGILDHLFPGDGDEHGLIIAAGVHKLDGTMRLLAREVFLAKDGIDYVAGRHGYRMLKAEFIHPVIRHCRKHRLAYLAVHNHGGSDRVAFSPDDLESHERGYPALLDLAEGMPVGGLVYAPRAIAGDIWMPDGSRLALEEARILGANIEHWFDSPRNGSNLTDDSGIHARQLLMFGSAGQARLREARVGVIGAGGSGSLIVEYLAHLGVGRIVLADDDRIALSNLSRVVGATRWDARWPFSREEMPRAIREWAGRHAARKIDIARRLIKRAAPACAVDIHFADFSRADICTKFLGCDFLFLAADSMRARLVFNAIVNQYFIPGIQVGSKIVPSEAAGTLDDVFSVERWVLPRTNCLWCSGMISPQGLALEAKSPEERRQQDYGTQQPNPSVITVNAVGAAHAVNDFLMSYLGLYKEQVVPRPRRFRHGTRELIVEEYPPDPECTECGPDPGSRFGRGDAVALPATGAVR
jgi:hypothetical protein